MATTKRRRLSPGIWFLAPFCLFFLLFFVLPIGYALYQSLFRTERTGLYGELGTHQVFAGFGNYAKVFAEGAFVQSVLRVLGYAVVQVPVMIVLATVLALLLDAASARGVRFFRSAFFLPYGVPGVIASILWGFLYTPGISPLVSIGGHLGLTPDFLGPNTVLWSIANIVTWQFAGYNMLVIIAQLKAVPGDLMEASRIDGANAWQAIWHIKLPLIRPAIVLATVFTIIGSLQLFTEPLVLQPLTANVTSTYTPNIAAYADAFSNNNYNYAAAEAVLLALIAAILSFGFLRLVGGRRRG
ncbi:carbohydrate ABC transporter permease [Actinocatenispora comari]|jgi:multiple sugar transport system permease protein|uniref:Sugar ABC transporter permease n=1 Tax=Actinocatenispora comari TaxID=2807577 RepID=A0A8J4EKI3_9ACTN|nr:sugar ABC transporter permease [Actinocatenispora comari]GIL26903.1 sugar ABC transporter permease [Actinocatenispora comari]